jgi:hypothetical protein
LQVDVPCIDPPTCHIKGFAQKSKGEHAHKSEFHANVMEVSPMRTVRRQLCLTGNRTQLTTENCMPSSILNKQYMIPKTYEMQLLLEKVITKSCCSL